MCSFAACMESFYHLSPLGGKRGGRAKSSEPAKVACLLASPASIAHGPKTQIRAGLYSRVSTHDKRQSRAVLRNADECGRR